ncbi:hypothetical protein [Planosporangium mesophilum]|uniref:Uncharacterized protein n=1 Tax=Planosporangium mesophilum TaxID=689768 RepID=A0A8J3X3E6_9ACTN|nr:hypothetical protein [Planosporangium mesophilum]NJC86799.1 hypothetical protein [Planosporangium mesophilum]GII26497.1 hypothetical protein Pme01_60940 [Planosporangium mesophilum]
MTGLDWRRHTIGLLRPCLLCHRPALMRDEHGQPCHKVCAEQAADRTRPARGTAA